MKWRKLISGRFFLMEDYEHAVVVGIRQGVGVALGTLQLHTG